MPSKVVSFLIAITISAAMASTAYAQTLNKSKPKEYGVNQGAQGAFEEPLRLNERRKQQERDEQKKYEDDAKRLKSQIGCSKPDKKRGC